mmetsp:Transcript_20238/g.51634  ORF Transcript_20238/g.51634 Transcript_20238/m.51634 type:complete len:349 (-) Transcript_20238:879-1925(-)
MHVFKLLAPLGRDLVLLHRRQRLTAFRPRRRQISVGDVLQGIVQTPPHARALAQVLGKLRVHILPLRHQRLLDEDPLGQDKGDFHQLPEGEVGALGFVHGMAAQSNLFELIACSDDDLEQLLEHLSLITRVHLADLSNPAPDIDGVQRPHHLTLPIVMRLLDPARLEELEEVVLVLGIPRDQVEARKEPPEGFGIQVRRNVGAGFLVPPRDVMLLLRLVLLGVEEAIRFSEALIEGLTQRLVVVVLSAFRRRFVVEGPEDLAEVALMDLLAKGDQPIQLAKATLHQETLGDIDHIVNLTHLLASHSHLERGHVRAGLDLVEELLGALSRPDALQDRLRLLLDGLKCYD